MTNQQLLVSVLESVRVGAALSHRGLTIYPVSGGAPSPLAYLLAEEAMALGNFRIGEVGAGSVPELLLVNDSDSRVFLLNGEELLGARQNRILNTSLIVEAHSQVKIPVSCVEQHRWSPRGSDMGKGGVSFPSMRSHNARAVHQSLRGSGLYHANQGEVWAQVSRKLQAHGVRSDTGAMEEIYTQHRQSLGSFADALPCPVGARGVVTAIGSRLVCADVFDSPSVTAKLWRKLIESYALDALEAGDEAGRPSPSVENARTFLLLPAVAEVEPYAAPGIGSSLRLKAGDASGSALVLEETVVHLEIFAPEPASSSASAARTGSRIHGPSRRRHGQ
jgi:hypothetical protein